VSIVLATEAMKAATTTLRPYQLITFDLSFFLQKETDTDDGGNEQKILL